MKNKKMKGKILGHVASISSFLVGSVLTHQAVNGWYWDSVLKKKIVHDYLSFFGIEISRVAVFDIGLTLMGAGFFTEFCLSFKPLEVKD